MFKQIVVSSFTALAIALGGAVLADQNEGPGTPKEVQDPVPDPAKQMKTEQMLKDEAQELSGGQGGVTPSEVKDPVPDAEAQAKTEKMLEEEKGALQGR